MKEPSKEPSKEHSYENRNSDLMNAEIYNALRSAGVAENEAEKAAKASARDSMQYIQLNQKIDSSVGELNQKIDSSVGELNQKIDISVAELKQDIGNLDHKVDISVAELKQDIGNVDQKLDHSVERLDQKIDNRFNTMITIQIGLAVGFVVVVAVQIITQFFF